MKSRFVFCLLCCCMSSISFDIHGTQSAFLLLKIASTKHHLLNAEFHNAHALITNFWL